MELFILRNLQKFNSDSPTRDTHKVRFIENIERRSKFGKALNKLAEENESCSSIGISEQNSENSFILFRRRSK